MSVNWFLKKKKQQISEHETHQSLDSLLELFRSSLCRYFGFDEKEIESIHHLASLLKQKELPKGEELFYRYMEEKMIPRLEMYLQKELKDDEQVKAKIEYNHYILGGEVEDFDYPEDVRSTLISIIDELPEYYMGMEKTC